MDINQYSKLALYTVTNMGKDKNLAHAVLGISGESGEIADLYKKHFAYGKVLDNTKMVEEIGDTLFYINLLITELGYTWGQVLGANIAKLKARYPDGKWTAQACENRQLQLELDAINQVI